MTHWSYYNEIDPYAVQWLRNLMAAGHIAPGYVDDRSIADVRPYDLRGFTQVHAFAGIGVWSHALRRAGWSDDRSVWTGSCPCQPFSSAGQGGGLADERHLWPFWYHLIDQCNPPVIFGEQVASKDAEPWLDLVQDDLEGMGHTFGAIPFPAASVGAPHIRDRLYWVAFANGQRARIHTEAVHARQSELGGSCSAGGMANGGSRLEGCDARSVGRERQATERGGATCELGNSDDRGSGRHAGAVPGAQGGAERSVRGVADGAQSAGATRGVADHDGIGLPSSSRSGLHDAEHHAESCGGAGRLAESGSGRWLRREGSAAGGLADGPHAGRVESHDGIVGADQARGATNGWWADAEWIPCRDGKARPVEPGTFPLAHGVANRVGRLRAFGNAIVAEQAQAWIEVVMECMP